MTPVSSLLIRDIVAQYPEAMPVLAAFGLDLCCGGAHSLEAACKAHGLDLDVVLSALEPVLTESPVSNRPVAHA